MRALCRWLKYQEQGVHDRHLIPMVVIGFAVACVCSVLNEFSAAHAQAAPHLKQLAPGKHARSAKVAKAGKASKSAKPSYKHPLELVSKVQGSGWYLPWYKRDPKNPNGKRIPVLIAEAKNGEIVRRNNQPEIV